MIKRTIRVVLAVGITVELAVGGSCISAQEHAPTLPAHHCDVIQPHTESEPQAPTFVRSTIPIATSADVFIPSQYAVFLKMIRKPSGKTFELA